MVSLEREEFIKNKLKEFLKNKYAVGLFFVIALSIILRYLYYNINSAVWWDEADYLVIGKEIALNRERPEWWSNQLSIRPPLLSLIFAVFFLLKSNETIIRFFTLLLPSVFTVYFTYAIGRDMYSKRVGLFASFFMAVFWTHLFYTARLLTDILATLFIVAAAYFFYSQYLKRKVGWALPLSFALVVLGFLTRLTSAAIGISIFIFLLITEQKSLLKNKIFWMACGVGVLFLSPYLVFNYLSLGSPLPAATHYLGEAQTLNDPISLAMKRVFLETIPYLFINQKPIDFVWFGAFLLGMVYLLRFFFYTDLIFKRKTDQFDKEIFLFLWILVPLIYFVFSLRGAGDRYLFVLMPAFYIGMAVIFEKAYLFLEKYYKYAGMVLILLILILGGYNQIGFADNLIQAKKDTYVQVKWAGEWLKQNAPPSAKVITASTLQNQYYSGLQSYTFYTGKETCETCQNEGWFNEKVKTLKPDYLIVSIFEPVFTPKWAYDYAVRYNASLIPVQIFFLDQQQTQPALIIYKFTNYNSF